MPGLLVNLGWHHLLEADPAALPAMLGVCRDLNIPARWHETERTLYICAPVHGRKVALAAGASNPDRVTKLLDGLRARLSAAGAEATILADPSPALHDQEVVLRLEVASAPVRGVSASYSWVGWRLNQKLAGLLTGELAAGLSVQDLGSRATLAGWRQPGIPVIALTLPDVEHSQTLIERCVDAICQGLSRFWSNPLLEEALAVLDAPELEEPDYALFEAEPRNLPKEGAPELNKPAETPRLIHEPEEEPRILLGPETIVAMRQEPLEEPLYEPVRRLRLRPRPPRQKAAEPSPMTAAESPAEVAPAPPQTAPPPQSSLFETTRIATSTVHPFRWSTTLAVRHTERSAPAAHSTYSFVQFRHVEAQKNHPR
ncbi:MAG TPA: hypothetical protein VD969_13805 [Symbiobacteriaceae bacterium]|nr:hypothetical protein [Symbiobacteriaceae bacterium]